MTAPLAYNSPHYVYRCFDADGRLVYVGCTKDPATRLAHHRSNAFWAGEVARVKMTVHPTKATGRAAERRAIRTESPRFNNMGRWATRGGWTSQQYVDFAHTLLAKGTFATSYNRGRLVKLFAEYLVKFGEPHPLDAKIRELWTQQDETQRRERALNELSSRARRLEIEAEEAAWLAAHVAECDLCQRHGALHPDCGDDGENEVAA